MKFVIQSKQLSTPDPSRNGFWYQEAPTNPPTPILNGHLYTLISFLDVGVRSNDEEFMLYFDKGLSALLGQLPFFDANGLAYYDSRRRIIAKPFYQKLHVRLLRFLAIATGEKRLTEFAERWDKGFREKWGMKAWLSYAEKTLECGVRVEGIKFPLSYFSYALGDSGLSIVSRFDSSSSNKQSNQ